MARIGFVGLGNMGGPMARNLLGAGHEVAVHDLVSAAVDAAVEAGARAAGSAAAAADCEVFFSMLPAGAHVEQLYLGDGGVLAAAAPGTVLVDCSTIDAATARRVAAAAAEQGFAMLDAPVSGGVGGARAGTLAFMVGGAAETVERVRPHFEVMGSKVFHAGDAGAGQVAKMCNNMLLAIHMAGTAEALRLGTANGLDPAVLSQIMKNASGGNWSLNVYNPWPGVMEEVPASRDYEGGFAIDLMLKDLALALDAARASDSATPMGSLARSLYALLRQQAPWPDTGRRDFSGIQRLYGLVGDPER